MKFENLNVYVVSLPVDVTISADLRAAAKHLAIQKDMKDCSGASFESSKSKARLERPSRFSELGQACMQCCDITGLQKQASKDAD